MSRQQRRTAWRCLLAKLCLLSAFTAQLAARPNVVVFLTDDQGWGDLSQNGNTSLATPNIDELAMQGASLDSFFVCPVCSPTRAEFLTGRYHPRGGVFSTSAGGERLDLDETTIAQVFQRAGYATAAFGKWHNGSQHPYHPNSRGFDHFYGFCSGHWGNYFDPLLERNGELTSGRGFIIDDLTDQAMAFIGEHQHQPFFVYLPYNTPHSPMQVPDRWYQKFADHPLPQRPSNKRQNLDHTRAALAMCENIDWNVGRVLKQLKQLDLERDTIVVYFHDNGPNGNRWNGGMKGRKGSTDEGGVRSPLLVRWPAKIKPNTNVPQIGAAIDLLPTLAELCDINIPKAPARPLDGVSLAPLLVGRESDYRHADRTIVSHWRGRVSVRSQRYRLDHRNQLYDMLADPGQSDAITAQQPQQTERLSTVANAFRQQVLGERGTLTDAEQRNSGRADNRPFVVGHPDATYTRLPARDAQVSPGIQRSNRYPNCSYFRNWTKPGQRIWWPVEIPTAGRFQVQVYYTCPDADVCATIELRCGEASLRGQVLEPHDPPQRGAEHDRVKRQESYVKTFRPLTLGTVHLPASTNSLSLTAIEIPGQQAMEFRMLQLKRLP